MPSNSSNLLLEIFDNLNLKVLKFNIRTKSNALEDYISIKKMTKNKKQNFWLVFNILRKTNAIIVRM